MRILVNGKETEVSAELPLIDELQRLGYDIPSLCYGRDMEHQASCMVCMVKNVANGQMIPSCSTYPQEGMSIETDTEEVLALRKMSLELLLSDHRADCEAPCTIVCPSGIDVAQVLLYYDRGMLDEAFSILRLTINNEQLTINMPFALTSNLSTLTSPPTQGDSGGLLTSTPALPCAQCKAPCEKACRRGTVDESVSIREILAEIAQRQGVKSEGRSVKREANISKNVFTSRLGRYTDAEKEWLKDVYSQPSRCLHCACEGSNKCKLRQLATDAHIKTPRYGVASHQEVKKQIHIKGRLYFEPAKCIRCGLCVYNSTDGFTFMHRGFDMQVVIPEESKKNVDEEIADICPTGALFLV